MQGKSVPHRGYDPRPSTITFAPAFLTFGVPRYSPRDTPRRCKHQHTRMAAKTSRVLQLPGAGEGPTGDPRRGSCEWGHLLPRAPVGRVGGVGGARLCLPVPGRFHTKRGATR